MSTEGQPAPANLGVGDATAEVPAVVQGSPQFRRPRRWRRLVIGGAAVLLAAGAGFGIWLGTDGTSAPSQGTVREVTAPVSAVMGTMTQSVTANGVIQPAQTADLTFAVAGRVTAVDVTAGQTVTTGQALATVAPTALEARQAGAQSTLAAAEARLAADRSSGAGTSQVAADQAAVASAQAQLTTADKSVNDAVLRSTITGEVVSVDLTVGEQVDGSGTSGAGHPGGAPTSSSGASSAQVTVVSSGDFVIDTTVDDTEIGQLAVGDHALVAPTGSSAPVPATVTFVGLVSTGTGIPSFPITIVLTGTPSGVYAGSGAQVTIVTKQLSHVLEIPSAAITYRGGRPVATVVSGDRRTVRPVTVGTTSNGMTEITSGLSVGERVMERIVTIDGRRAANGQRGIASKGAVHITGGVVIRPAPTRAARG